MRITEAGPNFKNIISVEAADYFESKWPNVLVAFSVGDIYTAIANYFKLEGLPQSVQDDFSIPTLCGATERAFLTLLQRGALDKFVKLSPLPEAAQAELDAMAGVTEPVIQPESNDDQASAIAKCANDFRNLNADGFRRRWMQSPETRSIYELAVSSGRL